MVGRNSFGFKARVVKALTVACVVLTACGCDFGSAVSMATSEAQKEAEKFCATQVTKCGESDYRKKVLTKKGDYVMLC